MKSFWNFLKKNKLYGAINLVGLTVSMAFVLLLAVYIQRQLSTDSFQSGNCPRILSRRMQTGSMLLLAKIT